LPGPQRVALQQDLDRFTSVLNGIGDPDEAVVMEVAVASGTK
jgi:hypothetical protein